MNARDDLEPLPSEVSFRPTGIGRYFTAGFLTIWLAGWAVGEVVAAAALGGIFISLIGAFPEHLPHWTTDLVSNSGVVFAVLFLVVWLALWTVGGLAALSHLLQSVGGEDRITLTASGLELVRRAGPFRKRFTFDRASIRRVRIRFGDGALVTDTASGTHVLTSFGSRPERNALVEFLHRHLDLTDADAFTAVPRAWTVTDDGDVWILSKLSPRARAIRSVVAWAVTALIGVVWVTSPNADRGGRLLALGLLVLLAAGAALSTWSRREWIVRRGELTWRWTIAAWTTGRTFRNGRLIVIHNRDSDNDSRYQLVVDDGQARKVIHSELHDLRESVDLGRWLADRSGFPFPIPEFGPPSSR